MNLQESVTPGGGEGPFRAWTGLSRIAFSKSACIFCKFLMRQPFLFHHQIPFDEKMLSQPWGVVSTHMGSHQHGRIDNCSDKPIMITIQGIKLYEFNLEISPKFLTVQ